MSISTLRNVRHITVTIAVMLAVNTSGIQRGPTAIADDHDLPATTDIRVRALEILDRQIKIKETELAELRKKGDALRSAIDKEKSTAAAHAPTVSVTVVKVDKGNDEITATIAIKWAKGAIHPKSEEITLVFLFQDNLESALKLDEMATANMDNDNTIIFLKSGNGVVIRETADRESRLSGTIVQVVCGDGDGTAIDWRKDGEYTFTLPTKRPVAFTLPTKTIHVGMFQETDPKKWQQSSTSYKSLGKAVELMNK